MVDRSTVVPEDYDLDKGARALAEYDGVLFDRIAEPDDYRRKALAVLQAVHGVCGIYNKATKSTCLWNDNSCGCNNDE